MTRLMISASLSLVVALFGTPVAIRFLRARGIGQLIREDGPKAHFAKKGTPTMGGVVIIGAALLGYIAAHFPRHKVSPFTDSGLLAVGVVIALGALGFLDDYIKIHKRRSLGLSKRWKIAGQAVIAIAFALIAGRYTQAKPEISFIRPLGINLGPLFVVWVFLVLSACSNGVNLTDGLDGLASGSAAMVMGAYVIISFWQYRHTCGIGKAAASVCYQTHNALDLAIVAAALLGATAGFLWWNAAPARIFMGDTGSLALGGAMGAMALLTNTQLLVIVLGGLYVIEVSSVILQVVSYRVFGRRALLMAPLHHHFELLDWPEFTVIVRFWILAGLFVAFGLGLFYADFIARGGVG